MTAPTDLADAPVFTETAQALAGATKHGLADAAALITDTLQEVGAVLDDLELVLAPLLTPDTPHVHDAGEAVDLATVSPVAATLYERAWDAAALRDRVRCLRDRVDR